MTKDTTITAQDGEQRVKPRAAKPSTVRPGASKPAGSKRKSAKSKGGNPAKAMASAPTKAAVNKAAKAVAKTSNKAAGTKQVSTKPEKNLSAAKSPSKPLTPKSAAKAKPAAKAKHATQTKAMVPAPVLSCSLQGTLPAAIAMNTKLVDIAHSNVSAGLELARDLAGAKTPMEAMRLGVAYWFNHIGAVQAQARELQSLSATWVSTASAQIRPL